MGGAGAGHPHLLQDVFEIGMGQVHVVFGHAVADLARDSDGCGSGSRRRAAGWWPGCGGPDAARSGRGRARRSSPGTGCGTTVGQRRACRRGCGRWSGTAPVAARSSASAAGHAGARSGPGFSRGAPRCVEAAVRGCGCRFVIADLGLVVPEHRKLAIAADAVQPQLENFAAAPAGDDDDFPDIAQPPIVRIVGVGERLQVCVVREGLGDVVAERIAGCLRVRSPSGDSMMNDLFSPISEARPDSRAR